MLLYKEEEEVYAERLELAEGRMKELMDALSGELDRRENLPERREAFFAVFPQPVFFL